MITIERRGTGFKMKFSAPGTAMRGFSRQARDLREVHQAINHYHGQSAKRDGYCLKPCPLCRVK